MRLRPIVALLAASWMLASWVSAQTPALVGEAEARAAFEEDVHASAGITCTACHAGAPDSYAIPRTEIATQCATCHSDAAYMRQFDPQVRVDQFAQYLTSAHGQQMAAGDERTATCSDCHGSHGVLRVSDTRAPVAPLRVATTCSRCHADGTLMAAFGLPPTPPADWAASVHATALLERGVASAPTCSSCHGSHGATPPGVTEVANVCSQCHVREADLFRTSPKQVIFDIIGQAECLVCHGNHRIEPASDSLIGLDDDAACTLCHDESTNGSDAIIDMRGQLDLLSSTIASADAVLARAERAGMLVNDGRASLRQAAEHRINAHVLVHAFSAAPLREVTTEGLVEARSAEASGNEAMRELAYRRAGLGLATLVIIGFLVTLGLKIRSLPAED